MRLADKLSIFDESFISRVRGLKCGNFSFNLIFIQWFVVSFPLDVAFSK